MLRAAAWTSGLFAVGGAFCHLFPGPFVEPLVLIVLGSTLFLVSGRAQSARPGAEADDAAPALPSRATR